MTSERDFDRLARAWLELGPDEVPDRVVAGVLKATGSTPQVRRRLRRPTWRLRPMNRSFALAAIAAALVVVVGGGIILTRPTDPNGVAGTSASPVTSTSAAPSASPVTSSAGGPIPTILRSTWIGPKRTIAGLLPSDRYQIDLGPSTFGFPYDTRTIAPQLASIASAPAPGQLQFVTTDATAGCKPGDVGRYSWDLSAGGVQLTIVAGTDTCVARAAALPGVWFRVACQNVPDGCLGDLEAGTFSSQYFTPQLTTDAAWRPTWGALTYTVPAGWANSADWPNSFGLTPSVDYAKAGATGAANGSIHEVDLYRRPAASAQDSGCSTNVVASVPTTVDGLIGYLTGLKSLVSTSPVAATVAGHPAKWIDIKIAPGWTKTCPDSGGTPTAVLLAHTKNGLSDYGIGLTGAEQDRMIFVDLGAGNVVLIAIDSTDPARFDELVAQATPIIATFAFK
jgi:hypothetical protein